MTTSPRLASLDQFRGYTVAGMCLANFLAPFAAIHSVLKHNDTYFSYADTIMPGFLFVVGFAFRLTYLKRRREWGPMQTAWSYVRRSGKLLLFSLLIYVFVGDIPRWTHLRDMPPEFQPVASNIWRGTLAKGNTEGAVRPTSTAADAPALAELSATRLAPLVSAEIDRLRAWRALDWQHRLLVHWRILAAKLIKSELWETLAIIGATQIVVLPWIGCPFWTRCAVMSALGAAHALISYWFNWDFLHGIYDNWMSRMWMTGDDRGWDGGIFGPLNWAIVMLGGTLAHDLVAGSASRATATRTLLLWGLAFLAAGYFMSCLTRLYDLSDSERVEMRQRHARQDAERVWRDDRIEKLRAVQRTLKPTDAGIDRLEGEILVLDDLRRRSPDLSLAESPVLPSWHRFQGRSLTDLLAEPPFVAPPADDPRVDPPPSIEHRLRNYWMLGKRMPNLSFITFATGFEFALFGLFVAACDIGELRIGLFRTLGTNPLAAYFIHGAMAVVLALLVPHDASLAYCLAGFVIAFAITYLLVRLLEKHGLYWRL